MAPERGEGCPQRRQPASSRDAGSDASAVGEETRLAFVLGEPADAGLERAAGDRAAACGGITGPSEGRKQAGEAGNGRGEAS